MRKFLLVPMLISAALYHAQYVSPGTGTSFTLSSLSAAAPTVLERNGNEYTMTDDITISAGDTLLMDEDVTVKIAGGKLLTIAGVYNTTASNLLVTAVDPAVIYKGIRLEETADVTMMNTTFEHGGGIQVLTPNFLMDNCIVRDFKSGQVNSGAMSFSAGSPVVKNSQFLNNVRSAFSSAANAQVSPVFENNYLFKNTQDNSNRPQINMGPSGAGITKVLNNTIIGDRTKPRVGGISVSSLLSIPNNLQIEGNTIKDNRYGITVVGNISKGNISNNIIEDNNSENDPMTGGSGISLSGNTDHVMDIKIRGNQFRGNLWGITIISKSRADLGTADDPGNNIFKNNGNSGTVTALYNNTVNAISAVSNCWREDELSTAAMVEEVIGHQVDDPSLGLVNFSPFLCAETLAANESIAVKSAVYPNPSNGTFTLQSEKAGNVIITDMSGRLVHSAVVVKGKNSFNLNLKPGVYILVQHSEGNRQTIKLMIK